MPEPPQEKSNQGLGRAHPFPVESPTSDLKDAFVDQGNIAAGSIEGEVVSFVVSKGYGFISGDDGERYFVHQKDVQGGETLTSGQRVAFVPTPSPKGSKARHVVPGIAPTLIYLNPDNFVWSKAGAPKGMEVMLITGDGWSQSNDPNEAREMLKAKAREYGANAVLNASLEKYTDSAACSSYRFTMHRFRGQFAIVKVANASSDPASILESQTQLQNLHEWWEGKNAPQSESWERPVNETRLIEPAKVILILGLIWSWSLTLLRILGLSGLFLYRQGVKFIKGQLAAGRSTDKKKPDDLGE
ncbi:cold shock domain-containing protein (plasmid) [Pseudomonas amygdali pv. lachrymans]|uniref:cold-shock protein n=1 Tax=Pseudomonas amygdali TaxID=47877 RepID=UPI000F3FD1D0|nr:cold shock domain-containing protein [Pseudomonas amygdali]RMM39045.1 hypothetical protein ALQ79_200337 [Pseudomonas amygdali pv. lachrymans]WIO61558.1 cold shock domain-containing protein [Pseudomonas amygdali pv. lachrymans]